jgi:hypothetical protein
MSAHIAKVDVYKSPVSLDFEGDGTERGGGQAKSNLNSDR